MGRSQLTDVQIVRAMQLLELRPDDFRAIEGAPTVEECRTRLAALKDRTKKRFRQLALMLHPDKTNNDPAKTEDFKLVSAAWDEFEKTQIVPRPPPPPQHMTIRVHFVRTGGYTSTSSTTTSTVDFSGFGF